MAKSSSSPLCQPKADGKTLLLLLLLFLGGFGIFSISAFSGVGHPTLTPSVMLVVSSCESPEQLWVCLASEFKEKAGLNPTWQSTKESQYCKVTFYLGVNLEAISPPRPSLVLKYPFLSLLFFGGFFLYCIETKSLLWQ